MEVAEVSPACSSRSSPSAEVLKRRRAWGALVDVLGADVSGMTSLVSPRSRAGALLEAIATGGGAVAVLQLACHR